MNPEMKQRLVGLAAQLAETLMTAAIQTDEIRVMLQTDLDSPDAVHLGRSQNAKPPILRLRPLVDYSTLSVFWAGKTCPLKNTILFRLAERLARQPNQYIPADQLLHDVWEGGVKSPDTIRSAIRHLRQRLIQAGMNDLAVAIHGTAGRYGLMINGTK